MKILASLAIFIIICLNCITYNAQGSIISISVSPSNPNINDTIYIYADLQFTSSECNLDNSNSAISGNTISAYSQHCLGMLTTICPTTDTFKISPLAVGTYSFIFTLSSGFGGPPCTPGIVADDMDTLTFNVTNNTTKINDYKYDFNVSFYPNPSNGELSFSIINSTVNYKEIIIYSINGKIINSYLINKNVGNINLNMESGIYFIRLKENNGKMSPVKKIIIN